MKDDDTVGQAEQQAMSAAPVTADLLAMAPPDLFEALGAQVSGAAQGSSDIHRFDVTVDLDTLHRGVFTDVGRRVFARWNRTLHTFLCKPSPEDADLQSRILKALTSKDLSASSLIIGVLVGTFGVAPAIATLIAALVVTLVVSPATDEICKYWDEQLASA